MKLIVAGGRDHAISDTDISRLSSWLLEHGVAIVIHGGASGADALGQLAATRAQIPFTRVPADWVGEGRAAGPLRNRRMAAMADAVLLYPGGRGTASMRHEATLAGLAIYEAPAEGLCRNGVGEAV